MKELKIAYGNSRQSKYWSNASISFEDLCDRLREPVRTPETVSEYQALTKPERDVIKDIGGFVPASLRDGRRKADHVEKRSMLVYDLDFAEPGFVRNIREKIAYKGCVYSTHSHTPDNPRIRVILPAARDMTPDEHNAVARYTAQELGILEMVDPCSFKPHQLMYWPSCPSDGEYVFCELEGEPVDPDKVLAAHPEWTECLALPSAPKESMAKKPTDKKQQDPLTKEGIVGVFCRVYTLQDAIEKFLPDVYEPASDGRYTYIAGESTAGLVLYDNATFAYSHHATDPAFGKLVNAFDLVRIHRFGDEEGSFSKMCAFAEADEEVRKEMQKESAENAKKEFEHITSSWEEPVPFGKYVRDSFPVDALPQNIRRYVSAYAKSIQVPIDMVACTAISVLATATQGKYAIMAKPDWVEPAGIYIMVIAPSSERKSTSLKGPSRPLIEYENYYNTVNSSRQELSRMNRRILLKKQKAAEEQRAKGNITEEEVMRVAEEIAGFEETKELKLFVDDITPEKLVATLEENNNRMAIISSEAGIFDILAGSYSSSVNIDVFLKGYSGDQIRVERVNREDNKVNDPTLTMHLMAQPSVISAVLGNDKFRGRGLVARVLFSMPESMVGKREYRTDPVPEDAYLEYADCIKGILKEDYPDEPNVITLSPEADSLFEEFSLEIEGKLKNEYADIADWCGKLAGNTLRIAGLLCRAQCDITTDFSDEDVQLVIDGETMANAIRIGRYFLNHAMAVFDVIPETSMYSKANRILKMIKEKKLDHFSRRDAMRSCSSRFKRVHELQPVLDFLEDGGYIAAAEQPKTFSRGRPPMPEYHVNPWVHNNYVIVS